MGAPSVTYKDFLTTLASDLATEYPNYKVTLEPSPRYKGYGEAKITVCPAEPCIVYEDTTARTKTERSYWVWYHARIYAFVILTDVNYEDSLTGVGNKEGVVTILENAQQHLEGNFLSLAQVKEINIRWDTPSFYYDYFEGEQGNFLAAMGSFVYKARLKQVVAVEIQATPPLLSNVQSTPNTTTCTITWDTDKPGTSLVKYGTGQWPPDWTDETTETSTYQTSHSVNLTGLSPGTTYYFKPWSASKEGWYGQTATVYSFSTSDAEDIVFNNFEVSKNPLLQTVIIEWDTSPATKGKTRWRNKDSSDAWNYSSLSADYYQNHTDNTTMSTDPGNEYEFQAYGITSSGTEEWDILRYIRIDQSGNPELFED